VLDAVKILTPKTVIGQHRARFRAYWRWKSRPCGSRPSTPPEIRQLICGMSIANPFWGAPRVHGELLKLGLDVSQTLAGLFSSNPAAIETPLSFGQDTRIPRHLVPVLFRTYASIRSPKSRG
jgi:hypothetical protein